MYTLQGYITELLAGRSWEDLVQTEIYDKVLHCLFVDFLKINFGYKWKRSLVGMIFSVHN